MNLYGRIAVKKALLSEQNKVKKASVDQVAQRAEE